MSQEREGGSGESRLAFPSKSLEGKKIDHSDFLGTVMPISAAATAGFTAPGKIANRLCFPVQGQGKGGTSMLSAKKKLNLGLLLLLISIILFPAAAQSTYTSMQVYMWDNYTNTGHNVEYENQFSAEAGPFSFGPSLNQYGYLHSASAYGRFDLAAGEMKLQAAAAEYQSSAFVSIYLREKFYPFWVSSQSGPMSIDVVFHVDGTFQTNSTRTDFDMGSVFWAYVHGGWQNYGNYRNLIDGAEDWTAHLTFTPGIDSYVEIIQSMAASFTPFTGEWFIADFLQTGTVRVILPEGAAFTSESGVFLTQTAVVPLPGSLLLLGTGLLSLGTLGWRRKRG